MIVFDEFVYARLYHISRCRAGHSKIDYSGFSQIFRHRLPMVTYVCIQDIYLVTDLQRYRMIDALRRITANFLYLDNDHHQSELDTSAFQIQKVTS